jgi:hypothetical protein
VIRLNAYAVNYDLRQPGRDYTGLYDAIRLKSKWWHYLDSTWLVVTDLSASELWGLIARHIDPNDRCLIIEVRGNYQGWLPKEAWEWIHENLTAW